LLSFGKPNALAVTRDFLKNCKRAPERLHAAALAILGVVVDVRPGRLDQPCEPPSCADWRASRSASTWFEISRIGSPRRRAELYQAVHGNR